ncbi:MAG: hypothetical protein CMH65_16075 [Nevskiales bacterium]|nr:hypothetical protein [Nevskiales bacterium]
MSTRQILTTASAHLEALAGHTFDLLDVTKPISPGAAANLAKVISKLSPLLGNLIEFNVVEVLNEQEEFTDRGNWLRQDPGFPDAIFDGDVDPTPGFEIKAWFPLATEITARFKDSQNHFRQDQTDVCLLAWLPEHIIYGKPKILAVCILNGGSIAHARDSHYHNPPDYLVLEPEDTSDRTANLQQTNTNGYKWQGTDDAQKTEAEALVDSWGTNGKKYSTSAEYQQQLRQLIAGYPYRLDTNFAKMDRIQHDGIEDFKREVLDIEVHGLRVSEWARLIGSRDEDYLAQQLSDRLNIKEADAEKLLK